MDCTPHSVSCRCNLVPIKTTFGAMKANKLTGEYDGVEGFAAPSSPHSLAATERDRAIEMVYAKTLLSVQAKRISNSEP